jgi:hypothetical protein
MKDSGKRGADMAEGFRVGRTAVTMRAIGGTIRPMAKAGWCMRMEILIWEIGIMIKVCRYFYVLLLSDNIYCFYIFKFMKQMDRVFIFILMLRVTKENGKTTNNMVTESKHGRNFPKSPL